MKNNDVIDVEITQVVDSNEVDVFDKSSFIEQHNNILSHDHLMSEINKIDIDELDDFADGKTYSTDLGTIIWRTQLYSAQKYEAQSESEEKLLQSALQLLYAYTVTGEYPLLQQLCNYFGISVDQYYAIMSSGVDPRSGVFTWIYNIFDAAAMSNAIRSNGNFNARQWIDRSREGRISAETAVQLAQNETKIDTFNKLGASIVSQLIGDFDD